MFQLYYKYLVVSNLTAALPIDLTSAVFEAQLAVPPM